MDYNTIYIIKNKVNNKLYIGQTWKTIEKRFKEHKSLNTNCRKLFNAMNKYGRNNFSIEAMAMCKTQEEADFLEDHFINQFDSINKGYNLLTGGSYGKHSGESKKLISESLKGIERNEEYRAKMAEAQKLRYEEIPFTDEAKQKISQANSGHIATEEHKQKISDALKAAYASGERISAQKGKPAYNKGIKTGRPAHNRTNFTPEQIEAIKVDTRSSIKIAKDYEVTPTVIQRLRKSLGIIVPRGNTGNKHSSETKEKISQNRTGKCMGEENGFFGKAHTEENKRINAEAHLGKIHSEETKRKMHESHLARIINK